MAATKETEHHPATSILAVPSQRQRVNRAICTAIHPLRRDLRNRTKDNIDDPQNSFCIAPHRFWGAHAKQRIVGNNRLDGLQHTPICRHVGKHMFDRHIDRRHRRRERDVNRPSAGFCAAREIKHHPVAFDGQIQRNFQWHVDDTVIVKKVFSRIRPVGQLGDIGRH